MEADFPFFWGGAGGGGGVVFVVVRIWIIKQIAEYIWTTEKQLRKWKSSNKVRV